MQTTPEMSVPALVMNCLAPSITHSPSSSRARVRDVAGVRAGLRLGQPEGAELLARAELRQPLALLLLGAEQVDRLGAERGVRAERDRDRGVDPRQLLDGERVGERVGAAAAVLLGERDAHQAELAELGDDLVREATSSRSSSSATGATSLLGEVADGALDQARARRRGRSPWPGCIPNERSNFEGSFGFCIDFAQWRPLESDARRSAAPPTRPALRARYEQPPPRGDRAAAQLFAERGYQATSMSDLTEATGLAAGGLYHYIESKDELLIRDLRRAARPAARARPRDRRQPAPPAEQLRALLHAWLDHIASHRDHMLVFAQERHVIEREPQWRQVRGQRKEFEKLLDDVLARGEADGHDALRRPRASPSSPCWGWSTTRRSG